jgi:hypothetical protein
MDKRHFTVVEKGGKEHGLYISSTPSSAAKKAVSKLCSSNKSKKVEFYLREITQVSKKKTYGLYVGEMKKLNTPIELKGRVIQYKPFAKLRRKSGTKKEGMIGGAPKVKDSKFNNNNENSAAGPAVNNRSFRDSNAVLVVNNNISGNSAAGPALAHNDSNNKKLKELCKKAILAIRGISSTIPGSNLNTFPGLQCLRIGFDHNELRQDNALFIKRERHWSTKEDHTMLPSQNMKMIDEEGKKTAVQRFISELNSDMSIDQIVKEAWNCVIYNAFQNFQIAFPRKVEIVYHSWISVPLGEGRSMMEQNKSKPSDFIIIHGFVNDFPKPALYDKSGLKQVVLMRKKTNKNYWNKPSA